MALDDEALTHARYGTSLQLLHAIRTGWEPGIETLLPGSTGPHTVWLATDLAALGLPPILSAPPLPLASSAQAWGARYVLEGSALGGRMLLRRTTSLGIAAHSGARYFTGHGEATGTLWRGFLARLEVESENPEETVAAARDAFDALARFATRQGCHRQEGRGDSLLPARHHPAAPAPQRS